jgi:uncharacterized protein DUF5666
MTLRLISLAVWMSIAACPAPVANAATPCEQPGGIGGTGIIADGGIGGTGIQADTVLGLIGVVTGFASVCVNGVEVHYDAATLVTSNGAPSSSAGALAVGQVVAVRAVGNRVEARARAIDVLDAVLGPVTAIERPGSVLQVLGQRVRLQPSTLLGPGLTREALANVRAGDSLRVSGLRRVDNSIVATWIDRAARDAKQVVADPSAAAVGPGRFIVQGYAGRMAFAADPQLAAQLAPDRLVRIYGSTDANGVRVVERAELLSSPLNPKPERAIGREASDRREMEERRGRGPDSARGGDSDRAERIDRSGSTDRLERPDRSGSDRVERPERGDRSGRH